jgi:hypothetical protein
MKLNYYFFILFLIRVIPTFAQDTLHREGKLIHEKDTLLFEDLLNITIHTSHDNDSITERVQVFGLKRLKDTLLIAPGDYHLVSYKLKDRKSMSQAYYQNSSYRIKIPVQHIDYIRKDNRIKDFMQPTEVVSFITGLIIAPLISLGNPFKSEQYYVVAGTSFAIFALSLTIDNIWGHTIFYTKPYKRKKVWQIE